MERESSTVAREKAAKKWLELHVFKQGNAAKDASGLPTEMLDKTAFFRLCCCKNNTQIEIPVS